MSSSMSDKSKGVALTMRLAPFADTCCRVMEQAAHVGDPYFPALGVYRRGSSYPVAVATPAGGDPGSAFTALQTSLGLVATGFDGDLLVLTLDTYRSDSEVNPTTGEPWTHGEMGIAFRLDNKDGHVYEALSMCAATSDGVLAYMDMPYHREGKHIHWLSQTEQRTTKGAEAMLENGVPQTLAKAWDGIRLRTEDHDERLKYDRLLCKFLHLAGLDVVLTEIDD